MIRGLLSAGLLVAAAAAPATAQENAAMTRIDDFAPSASNAGVAVAQVGDGAGESSASRAVDTPVQVRAGPITTKQLSGVDERQSHTAQLAPAGDRSPQAAPPLSSRTDGRPGNVVRLDGQDRCDPQDVDAKRRDLCRRVLELRAREFSATQAPKLSAEEALLAQQFRRELGSLSTNADLERRREAADPEETATQELGFLLSPAQQPPASAPAPADKAETLGEALKGVLVDMGAQARP
jgi:hypothetical protein